MQPDLYELRAHVAGLSDEALLEVKPEELVESARAVYEEELTSRGLTWGAAAAAADASSEESIEEELVSLAKFESIEEARFARTMLENEGIAVWFAGELSPEKMSGDPIAALELVTKAELVEQAQAVLQSQVSEEELARQAEEAGPPEEEFEPEEDEEEEESEGKSSS